MTYVFDIDGTICTTSAPDYANAEPLNERIKVVNKLYDEGNIIFFNTARGMGRTGNNHKEANRIFFDMTLEQLEKWGVKYHRLMLGKPSGDIYVDDKGINDERFFAN